MSIWQVIISAVISSLIGLGGCFAWFTISWWLGQYRKKRIEKLAVKKRWADIEAEGPEPTLDNQTFELSKLLPLPTLEKWADVSGIKSMNLFHWMKLSEPTVIETKSMGTIRTLNEPTVKAYVHFTDPKEAMLFKLAFGGVA